MILYLSFRISGESLCKSYLWLDSSERFFSSWVASIACNRSSIVNLLVANLSLVSTLASAMFPPSSLWIFSIRRKSTSTFDIISDDKWPES